MWRRSARLHDVLPSFPSSRGAARFCRMSVRQSDAGNEECFTLIIMQNDTRFIALLDSKTTIGP